MKTRMLIAEFIFSLQGKFKHFFTERKTIDGNSKFKMYH